MLNQCYLTVNELRNKKKFTIGAADQSLIVNVTVANHGEDSYESQFFITIPSGFEYGGVENYATQVCTKI